MTGACLLFSFQFAALSQTNIGGVINTVSARVDQVYGYNSLNKDSVHVSTVAGFQIGDTVLIHITVGAGFYTAPLAFEGKIENTYNTGRYGIYILDSIDVDNNFLILNTSLEVIASPLAPGEFGQIVKIPTYKRAKITSTLTCNPYDTASKTGGILVLMVKQGLIFEADINVEGKGFPGATPDPGPYSGTCSTLDANYQNPYFNASQSNYSAPKGYSFSNAFNPLTRGKGAANIGGGGGNGKYSGGGGGANLGDGGQGGYENAQCSGTNDLGGRGGRAASTVFYEFDNRISPGGGGGTSSQNPAAGDTATAGGNGGGIVIIVCDTLKAVGSKNINAKGQSVLTPATAGAGGGGGGGAIILHVNKFDNMPKLLVNGGVGGGISSSLAFANGPGGGGGSGAIWYNGAVNPGLSFSSSAGAAGKYKSDVNGASAGSSKANISGLLIPIKGFLFNTIPDPDTVCKFVAPKPINAPPAVGGKGAGFFSYNWLQSKDSLIWENAAGTRNLTGYTPPDTTKVTMWYKRYVTDGLVISTSNVVKMVVLPNLVNNIVMPDTTVCTGLDAGTLRAMLNMSGGNGSYQYTWAKSFTGTFADSVITGTSKHYPTPAFVNPDAFNDTVWFRRSVASSACRSTSNVLKIIVLPAITNNTVAESQEICISRTPEGFKGNPALTGGNFSFRYQWQKENTPDVWNDLSADTLADYQSPALSVTGIHNYRRMAYSGPAKTCKSFSPVVSVSVMPAITDNSINLITQDTLCSGLNGEILTATDPAGGNATYNYSWLIDGIAAPGGNVKTGFDPGILTATSTFRRVVNSGTNDSLEQRCWSNSNTRQITILEKITNNLISVTKSPNIWCEGKSPEDIAGSLPLNGNGIYSYFWQNKTLSGTWNDMTDHTINLNTPVITNSINYRRIVRSGLNGTCENISDSILFTMQDSILNNRINENNPVFICFDQDSVLQATTFPGSLSGGDGAVYNFLWTESPTLAGVYVNASEPSNTSELYTTEAIQTSRYYKRRVISGDCENTSLPVKADPLPLPELTSLSVNLAEICFNKLDSIINLSVQFGSLPYVVGFNDGQGLDDARTLSTASGKIKPAISNPTLNPGYIDYNFTISSLRDVKNCYAKSSNISPFSAPLRVYATPMPERISAPVVESCSSTLQLSVTPSFGLSSWHLRNVIGLSSGPANSPDIDITADFSSRDRASATLAYVEDIANCPSDTILVDAILYNNPDSVKNIYRVVDNQDYTVGDTILIFISDNQVFKADPIVSGVPGWRIASGAGELSLNNTLITSVAKLDQDDPAFLEYKISNGVCTPNTRTIKIIRKELLVYDGFSPNDDQINDELWAVGLADEEVDFRFQIFSSAGNFIREITRKDIQFSDLVKNEIILWDGSTNLGGAGNFVPDGTYYYVLILTYHGQQFNKRGYVIVKR